MSQLNPDVFRLLESLTDQNDQPLFTADSLDKIDSHTELADKLNDFFGTRDADDIDGRDLFTIDSESFHLKIDKNKS